ncbi:MAG: ribulose-phosphate 3-epimerase [Lachnospiraceae bacterium]|nr:ribulose-phosphate 3-epimerase [Lachnospiraceae bacterium]
MYKLAPSILNADYGNLESEIVCADKAGADMIHLDVMDGMFVPCISFGWEVIKRVRHCTNKKFDVHLMINDPDRYLKYFKDAGADIISVHAEACSQLDVTIDRIRDLGCKVGVVLNPATSLTTLDFVLEKIDLVLLMTVNPGFGGQKYMTSMTRKITELRRIIDEREFDVEIEVDGGITVENVRTVLDAGADIIVSGSGIYKGDVTQNVTNFLEIFKEYDMNDGH